MSGSFALKLDRNVCTGCGLCADACTYGAIAFDGYPVVDEFLCRLCGSCAGSCPSGALSIDGGVGMEAGQGNGIWVLAETENGAVSSVVFELLGKARELASVSGETVSAVLAGCGVGHLSQQLLDGGADRVYVADSAVFRDYIEENYADLVVSLSKEYKPAVFLVGATQKGRGLSARIASMLETGLTADCTSLRIDSESGLLLQIRPAFGGNLMAEIKTPDRRPQMASVRPGVMKRISGVYTGGLKEIVHVDCSSFVPDSRSQLLEEVIGNACGDVLEGSRIIVAVGRGVKNARILERIHRWADSLGAVLAGSRAAVEAGLVDASVQIGQTGHTVSPDLYVAIGISGQIQHTAAITGAKCIVAVNPDRKAPVFAVADYGIAANIEDVLPDLECIAEKIVCRKKSA